MVRGDRLTLIAPPSWPVPRLPANQQVIFISESDGYYLVEVPVGLVSLRVWMDERRFAEAQGPW
jgi:hypothetical protein